MGTKTALQVLVETANADIKERVEGVDCLFGWRQPNRQQLKAKRVVWTPGDEAGNFGKELGATKVKIPVGPNQFARNLADIDELWHVQLQAWDATTAATAANEEAQYNVVRMLFDAWRAAVSRACHGTRIVGVVHIDAGRWIIDTANEMRHGATLQITGRVRSPVPDDAIAVAQPQKVTALPAEGTVSSELEIPITGA